MLIRGRALLPRRGRGVSQHIFRFCATAVAGIHRELTVARRLLPNKIISGNFFGHTSKAINRPMEINAASANQRYLSSAAARFRVANGVKAP